jgi:hypothetical protein
MTTSSDKQPRMRTAIAWYHSEEWHRWKEISDDRDTMCESYDHWLEGAEHLVKTFTKDGVEVHRVEIGVDEFVAWATKNGVTKDGRARSDFASQKLGKMLMKPDIPVEKLPDAKKLKEMMKDLKIKDLSDPFEPYLRRPRAAVCPIFRDLKSGIEQFGSGVLVRIGDAHFLLTVAHVMDEIETGVLMIPSKSGFIPLSGLVAGSKLPESGFRKDDRYDIAYVRLDAEVVSEIHDDFLFLNADDSDAFDETASKDAYTIIGYPARRSGTEGNIAYTDQFSLSGEGVADSRYGLLGCNPRHHILVQCRRNRTVRYSDMRRQQFPLPEGLSGGGVFAWDKDLPKLSALKQPKLIGILTEYHRQKNVFVGTRLGCYLTVIHQADPTLPILKRGG